MNQPDTGNSGDGQEPGDASPDLLSQLVSTPSLPSAIKEFVHPGKRITELLMRAVLKDERQRNAFIHLLNKVREFHDTKHEGMLFDWLASSVSLAGRGREDLLQAVVGALRGQKEASKEKAKNIMERLNPQEPSRV